MSVWFNGYTPNLATAAMIAGANREGTPITLNGQRVGGSYIGTAHGSTVAGPDVARCDARRADLLDYADFMRPSYVPSSSYAVRASRGGTGRQTPPGRSRASPGKPGKPRR